MMANVEPQSMAPDQLYGQRAIRWTQARYDQAAYRDAIEDVQQEARGFDQLVNGPAGQVG